MTQYYLVTADLNLFKDSSEWQLKGGNIIEDVGSNLFVANTVKKLIQQIKTYFNTDHKTYIIV